MIQEITLLGGPMDGHRCNVNTYTYKYDIFVTVPGPVTEVFSDSDMSVLAPKPEVARYVKQGPTTYVYEEIYNKLNGR